MFCLVKNDEKDGLGKLIRHESKTAVIEYFDSPSIEGRLRRNVSPSLVVPRRLGRNTRVFTFNEVEDQWRIGRVLEDDGEGVEVRFPGKVDRYLGYDQIFVRWKRPIQDPVSFLGNFVTETPQFAEARSGFLKNYFRQRGSAFGISALLSSSIELESHQIDVVRRVLTDHSQRYLLADEVGLGKTIEAGVIIRQAVLDDLRTHRVLVLVPHALVDQWREELLVRFGLGDFIDVSVFVLPQEDTEQLREVINDLSLIVIDEAHHLTNSEANAAEQNLYQLICDVVQRTARLLLLSATPILRNEASFLRMLHLLDPVVYPLDDLENFHSKVTNRQALAETVAALDPSNVFFMDSVLDDLIELIPNDLRLAHLTGVLKDKLLELPEEDDQEFCDAVRHLQAHISETYRLNRRILRNRRSQVEGLTPDRDGVQVWKVLQGGGTHLELALEEWRINATLFIDSDNSADSGEIGFFYWKIVCASFYDQEEVRRLLDERRRKIDSGLLESFRGESELLGAVISRIDEEEWLKTRINRLSEGLRSLPGTAKVVVFCSNQRVADAVFSNLRCVDLGLVRHSHSESYEGGSEKSWKEFITNREIRVIVCDRSAEEGINLQGGDKVVVHFDLPLDPNRIEQRMGRVDRYGSGSSIQSYVLLDEGSIFQTAWLRILKEGWRVFNHSISSLQYLVEAELNMLEARLLHGGVEEFDAAFDRLSGSSGSVDHELKLIAQQDALDALSPVPEADLEDLFDIDAEWRDIRDSMMYWIKDTLMFRKVDETHASGSLIVDTPFRFQYCSPNGRNLTATLIPLTGFIDDFLGAIDFDAPRNNSSQPQSYPYAVHRPTAVRRNVRPLRYGAEFLDAIKSFSDLDERGRSYAMWRQVYDFSSTSEIKICFRFDFLIESCLDEAIQVLTTAGHQSGREAKAVLTRRGDSLFSPRVMQVWLDEEGDELAQDFIELFLAPEYAKRGGEGYIDKNLSTPYFSAFRRMAPGIFSNWRERCERMRDRALTIMMARSEVQEWQQRALERGVAEAEVRYAQLQTRIQSLHGQEADSEARQLKIEQALNEALHNGILSPSVKVDVAGVVFLTSEPVSLVERHIKDDA
jgi:ATP-dependent helicase HepA